MDFEKRVTKVMSKLAGLEASEVIQVLDTVKLILTLNPSILDLKKLEFKGKVKVPWKDLQPMDKVLVEQHSCSFEVAGPSGTFRPIIATLTDIATGMIIGWSIGRTKSQELVSHAVIKGLSTYGYFKELYLDKRQSMSDEVKQRLKNQLNIDVVCSLGYSPLTTATRQATSEMLKELFTLSLSVYVGDSARQSAPLNYPKAYQLIAHYMENVAPHCKQKSNGNRSAVELCPAFDPTGISKEIDEEEYKELLAIFDIEKPQPVIEKSCVRCKYSYPIGETESKNIIYSCKKGIFIKLSNFSSRPACDEYSRG